MKVTRSAEHIYTDESGRVLLGVSGVLSILSGKEKEEPSPNAIAAMARGTAAHLACEYDDEGALEEASLDPITYAHLAGWRKFKAETGFIVEHSEQLVWSEPGLYAGTLDRIGSMANARWVVDIKTGAEYATHPIQTAAYAIAAAEREGGAYAAFRRACVYLTPTGGYRLVAHKDKNDKPTWEAALKVSTWRARNG